MSHTENEYDVLKCTNRSRQLRTSVTELHHATKEWIKEVKEMFDK